MKKIKSLLCILLALLLAFSAVSCKDGDDKPDDGDNGNVSVDVPEIDYNSEKKYIVRDGISDYKIVVGENALDAELFASQELKAFIEQSTGVKIPVITDKNLPYNEEDKLIGIGVTALLHNADLDADYADVSGDSFIIKTKGNLVLIKGGSKRGTLYGVYDFLERFVGVKFLASDSTYVPESSEVYVHDLNIKEVPAFEHRIYFQQQIRDDALFAARSRLISLYSPNISEYGGGYLNDWGSNDFHNFLVLIPYEAYSDHEDWFGDTGEGKVLCLTNGITENGEIDESNNDSLIKEMIRVVKEWILSMPEAKYFFIGQSDTGSTCNCSRCSSSHSRNGNASGTLMVFINCIAREIEKWRAEVCPEREIYIATFAYRWSLYSPTKLNEKGELIPVNDKVVPNDNVIVYYAASSSCFYHALDDESCSNNSAARAHLAGWTEIAKHMIIYYYGVNFSWHLWYFPNFSSMKQNLLNFRDMGAIEVIDQAAPRECHYYDPLVKTYVYSKLMWNPELDVNALIKEFNRYYFGEKAGAYVDFYHDLMERHYAMLNAQRPFHTDIYEQDGIFTNPVNFPKGLLEQACRYIETAITEVNADSSLSVAEKQDLTVKLTKVLVQPQFMILKNFDSYYDSSLKSAFAKKFFDNCNLVGIVNCSEGHTMDWYKDQFDLG